MIPHELLVHVGGPGRECAPGIVLAAAHVSRVRVIRSTPLAELTGSLDQEGDVRNWRETRYVPTPDGELRALDTWHYQYECVTLSDPLARLYPPVPDGYVLDSPEVLT